MTNSDDEALYDFVNTTFGESSKNNLRNIHTGGTNNAKGNEYELFFQLYKVFEIAAQGNCDYATHEVRSQPLAFIDDLCHIDNKTNTKHNYQAKNSNGNVADWSEELTQRIEKQIKIDTNFYNADNSFNYLLVSSKQKHTDNQSRIPSSLAKQAFCIHFPYCENLIELVDATDIGIHVGKLIKDNTRSNIDYAIKLMKGCIGNSNNQTLEQLFKSAESDGNPNPFKTYKDYEKHKNLPSWLINILNPSKEKISYWQTDDIFNLEISGLVVTVPMNAILNATATEISLITSPQELAEFCLDKMASTLEHFEQ